MNKSDIEAMIQRYAEAERWRYWMANPSNLTVRK